MQTKKGLPQESDNPFCVFCVSRAMGIAQGARFLYTCIHGK